MTDIVERLRELAREYHQHRPYYTEAADEIERLRMALRINGLRWGHTHKEIDALIADQDNKP